MDSAQRSHAIVSSLFPAEVQARLFNKRNGQTQQQKSRNIFATLAEGPRLRLKAFLNDEGETGHRKNMMDQESDCEAEADTDAPIADLFPSTTVMFADIAGFTAWCSIREPTQVFIMLETVYRNFDRVANRRRIFKVET